MVNNCRVIVTDEMVAEALDAKASMSQLHMYLYSTEKCRCGEEWTDAHWMRFILERAISVAEEPEREYGVEIEGVKNGEPFTSFSLQPNGMEYAERHAADLRAQTGLPDWQPNITAATVVRRRKAGPWVPVEN